MKQMLLSALIVAFLFGECGAFTVEKLPTPPPAPAKKTIQKKKIRKVPRKGTMNLKKKAEKDAKRYQVEMQRREFQMMQETQRRGMQQQHQILLQRQNPS